MKYYPVFLDLRDRPCLVIGNGPMADNKASLLEQAGADVRRTDNFNPEIARDCFLLVAIVNDPEQGRHLKAFGDHHRIFVNVVDQTDSCTFIAPAIVDRGNLLIAVSTSGKSPALASRIRRDLENQFSTAYSELLEILGEIRPHVKKVFSSFEERKKFYANLVKQDLLEILDRKGRDSLKMQIQKQLKGKL